MLIYLVTAAVVSDIRTYRISNRLNAAGCICGIFINVYEKGVDGALLSIKGMMIPVGILFILFALRIVGAGDIKLLAAMGAIVGVNIWRIVVMSFIIAGIYGVYIAVFKHLYEKKKGYTRIHLSICIAVGALIYMIGGFALELQNWNM